MAEPPPWDKKAPPKPFKPDPGTAEGPQSTVFVGKPTRPKQDESAVLLVETKIPYLAATAGPGKGKQWQLRAERVFLGREQPADVIVDDPAASRRHAQVYKKNGRWFLKDLDSTNGTYLDGPLRGTERILWDGDVFRIGDWEITFSDPASARQTK